MKMNYPSGLRVWSSKRIEENFEAERPIIYAVGALAFVARAFRVASPIPAVAPAKAKDRL
jgi:hypothetical protein